MDKSIEQLAEHEINKACAEIMSVANEIARQTNTHFRRVHTTWTTINEFVRVWAEDNMLHVGPHTYKDIHIDVSDLSCNEAIELAWDAEAMFNEHAAEWRAKFKELDKNDDLCIEAIEFAEDLIDKEVDATLEKIASRVDDWIDSAECWYGSDEWAEEVA